MIRGGRAWVGSGRKQRGSMAGGLGSVQQGSRREVQAKKQKAAE